MANIFLVFTVCQDHRNKPQSTDWHQHLTLSSINVFQIFSRTSKNPQGFVKCSYRPVGSFAKFSLPCLGFLPGYLLPKFSPEGLWRASRKGLTTKAEPWSEGSALKVWWVVHHSHCSHDRRTIRPRHGLVPGAFTMPGLHFTQITEQNKGISADHQALASCKATPHADRGCQLPHSNRSLVFLPDPDHEEGTW